MFPDAEATWMACMRRGDFAAAWAISDAVLRQRRAAGPCWHLPRHQQYVWKGDSLHGKRVLVRCYHGLGDTIQFIRFARPLRRIAREVIFWVQPELLSLVATAPGIDRAYPLHDGSPDFAYETDIEVMELPHALRVSPDELPGPVPYLDPPAAAGPPAAREALSVGLVWQAGTWDARRSIPAALLRPLARVPHIRLFSLQRGTAAHDAAVIPARDIGCDDIHVTARRMCGLDLIVSVDTLAAHLAGALGRPCLTLLHADCDWRWMRRRSDSVWYPTMKLFRQERPEDWQPVIDELCAAVRWRAARRTS